jgi:hypothetical protein
MRRMSYALTSPQILFQTKFVTRRFGWDFLKPGDLVQPIEKGMGLKICEKQKVLGCPIEVGDVRKELLNQITPEDVALEGFPGWSPERFIDFFANKNRCPPNKVVNRIEFDYTEKRTYEKAIVFAADGDFGAVRAAEEWLKTKGVSCGSSCACAPQCLLIGDYRIAKWRNLSNEERKQCHGTLDFDRGGPAIVRIKSEFASLIAW